MTMFSFSNALFCLLLSNELGIWTSFCCIWVISAYSSWCAVSLFGIVSSVSVLSCCGNFFDYLSGVNSEKRFPRWCWKAKTGGLENCIYLLGSIRMTPNDWKALLLLNVVCLLKGFWCICCKSSGVEDWLCIIKPLQ